MMKKLMERKRNRLFLVRMWRFHVCVCGDTNNRENVGNQVNWLKNGACILDQKNPGLLWHLRKIILIEDIKAYDKRLGEHPPLLSPIPKCLGFFLLDLPWQMVIYFLVKVFYKMFCQVQEELMTQLRKMKLKRYIFWWILLTIFT